MTVGESQLSFILLANISNNGSGIKEHGRNFNGKYKQEGVTVLVDMFATQKKNTQNDDGEKKPLQEEQALFVTSSGGGHRAGDNETGGSSTGDLGRDNSGPAQLSSNGD